jgi:hypothetical protein
MTQQTSSNFMSYGATRDDFIKFTRAPHLFDSTTVNGRRRFAVRKAMRSRLV